jgi:uncharacterized protein YbaP (TraB family)
MAKETANLEEEIKNLKKSNDYLTHKCSYYENGDAKLYYALQRKMSEMANTLNKQNLENVDLDDRNSKAFDRIIAILQKCETISASASALGAIAGVTGDEQKDTTKPGSFLDQIVK